MGCVAAFGIGSTNFRYAAGVPNGDLLTDRFVEGTRPRELIRQLVEGVEKLRARAPRPLDAVAVSCPGLVDPETGVVADLDTVGGETLDPIELGPRVEAAVGLPVFVENDCSASALGEWHYGTREGSDSVAHVTFGTGIGGGVVEDGRLVRGAHGQAGEFGLLPIAPDCGLESGGVRGAWEACCSGRGIPEYVAHRLAEASAESVLESVDEITAQDVFEAAEAGDAFARECLQEIHRYNAAGIAALCNAFNPGLVTLGGGVALHNQAEIVGGIEAHLEEYLFVDRPEIRISQLGDDIGVYGALATYVDSTPAVEAGEIRAVARGQSD